MENAKKKPAMTLVQAQAESRKRLIEGGGRRVDVRLEAVDLAALNAIKNRYGLGTDKEAIQMALQVFGSAITDVVAQ